ncbi:MAG TPA: MFS transporter [Clostridiales bacterium UBA8960]|jgi:MFS family permease|nr:MFS transporter [Clostridiales bacterium UBA8960]
MMIYDYAKPMPMGIREKTNFWLYMTGKGVSIFGSSIYSFAIGLFVLKMTGSALNYATTLMLSIIPMILISPLAGVLADRLPKKWLVVGMDVANGTLFLLLYLYSAENTLSLGIIYSTTILLNIFTTFFGIGMESAKPNLVTREKLVKLNASGKLIDSSSSILAPMLGGVVFAMFNIRAFILINGISFILSAFTECFIDYDFNQSKTDAQAHQKRDNRKGFVSELGEGWKTFVGSKLMMDLFFIFVSLNFVLGFSVNVPGPYIINALLGLSSQAFGLINAIFPIGLIIGTLTVERLMKRVAYKKLLIAMNAFIAVLAMAVGIPSIDHGLQLSSAIYVVYFSALYFMMGVAIAYVDVPLMTLIQDEVPREKLGRVLSIIMSLVKIVLPVALLLSGALISMLPVLAITIIGGLISLTVSRAVSK